MLAMEKFNEAEVTKLYASKATPDREWEATIQELDENLLETNAVKMVMRLDLKQDLVINELYPMFLKQKITGSIKARGCSNNRLQREFIGKEESSAPTMSIYILMENCGISDTQGRKVVTCDILGAFL